MNHPEALQYFIDHISEESRQVFLNADQIAKTTGHPMLLPEHLTLGVLSLGQSDGAAALNSIGITFANFREALLKNCPGETNLKPSLFSTIPEETLQIFRTIAEQHPKPDKPLATTDILAGIFAAPSSLTLHILNDLGLTYADVIEAIGYTNPHAVRIPVESTDEPTQASPLERFTVNLTARAEHQELDPVIGRDREIFRLRTILGRRQKNNPLLIGEPGVGKTALVEGLATELHRLHQPHTIYQLDFIALLAGTSYHGEFERRMQGVLQELEKVSHPILFLDEGHLIANVGGGGDGIDLANLLKPALARGRLSVIAATTAPEYHKSIERDKALRRRFQPISVAAPDDTATVAILRGLKAKYEHHHHITVSDDLLETAVRLARRYLKTGQFPDKALDLLDEAGSLAHLEIAPKSGDNNLTRLKTDRKSLRTKLEQALEAEDYEGAAKYKSEALRLDKAITAAQKRRQQITPLTLDHLARALADRTGLPVAEINQSADLGLKDLAARLETRLIGQPQAVATLTRLVRRAHCGLADPRRPLGSCIFLGPTGVGKTELARLLAAELFHTPSALIKLDMSEFAEKHTVARLIGAPAGYVGYDEGGALTERVKHQPNAVVLFDEIEKAHPEVYNLLLQILEDGTLTDGSGETVSFTNTYVILTSNLGMTEKSDRALGFTAGTPAPATLAESALKKALKPELLNRFDEIITFNPLTATDAARIFDLLLAEITGRLQSRDLQLAVRPAAKTWLLEQGWSAKEGARSLRRTLDKHLVAPLADYLLTHDIKHQTLSVNHKKSAQTIANAREDASPSNGALSAISIEIA
jgi:ATP-dependent Clp protease ATP-binding subunit ClpC